MIKDALEKVISEDLSEIWTLLDGDEKRKIIDSFTLHHFKKNQIIYAEHEEPEYLWCLLKGKAKLHKDGVGGRQKILRVISRCSILATALISLESHTCRALRLWSHPLSERYP